MKWNELTVQRNNVEWDVMNSTNVKHLKFSRQIISLNNFHLSNSVSKIEIKAYLNLEFKFY